VQRGGYLAGYLCGYLIDSDVFGDIPEAVEKFYLALGYSATNIDSVWDTNEIRVFELDSSAFIPVVQENVCACGFEFRGDLFSCGEKGLVADVGDRDDDLEGCYGWVKGIGGALVRSRGGFDGGGEDALDADAVATHDRGNFFAVAVEDGSSHGLRVPAAQFKDVADLDSFAEAQGLAADGVELSFDDVANIRDKSGFEVAHGGDVAEVVLLFVGSCD